MYPSDSLNSSTLLPLFLPHAYTVYAHLCAHTSLHYHTSVTHCLIGNIAIFSKHFIGWSAAVKANTRTVGHDYNLVVAAEEQEQAHTSHMTNM